MLPMYVYYYIYIVLSYVVCACTIILYTRIEMDCKEWYVNTMNLTVSLTLMMFRLHAQFQVNSEGSLQLSVVHSMMIPVPCATCGGETEKRVYPSVKTFLP